MLLSAVQVNPTTLQEGEAVTRNIPMGKHCMAWSCANSLGHQGCTCLMPQNRSVYAAGRGRNGLAIATLMRDLSTRVSSCSIPSVPVICTGASHPMGSPQAVTRSVLASMASNVSVNSAKQTSVVRCNVDNAKMCSLESAAFLLTKHSRQIVDQKYQPSSMQ